MKLACRKLSGKVATAGMSADLSSTESEKIQRGEGGMSEEEDSGSWGKGMWLRFREVEGEEKERRGGEEGLEEKGLESNGQDASRSRSKSMNSRSIEAVSFVAGFARRKVGSSPSSTSDISSALSRSLLLAGKFGKMGKKGKE